MTREIAIKTAAKWWADKLRKRDPHSNGDNNPASVFACMFADMGKENIPEKKLTAFTAELESQIRNAFNLFNSRNVEVWLGCDYGPCRMLSEAADEAGIKALNFPFKTHMFIKEDGLDNCTVKVSDGYAQPYVKLDSCE